MTSQNSIRVIVFTYNQETFIQEALESVMRQVSSLPISITVHDDCSTDSTVSAVKQIMKDSPHEWELISPKNNRYQREGNFTYEILKSFDENFIARLDGDDYWTNPNKLELQAEQLLRESSSALSHHSVSVVKEGKRLYSWPPKIWASNVPGVALSQENFIGASTVMIRRESIPKSMPAGYKSLPIGDYPQWSLMARRSNISFIDQEMSVYRIHENNSWILKSNTEKLLDVIHTKMWIASAVDARDLHYWRESILKDINGWVVNKRNSDPWPTE